MTVIGEISLLAKIDTSAYKQGEKEIEQANSRMESSGTKSTSSLSAGFKSLGKVGVAALAAVGAAITAVFVKNIGNAVKRVDTLVAFPRVLQAMGASSADAAKSTSKLAKSLDGLPTTLQEGAVGVQQFVASGLDANKATDAFLAMNNALLAGGGNAQDAGIVIDSLTRALSGGSTQATTIQAALSRMPTALQGLQKATGKSAGELYKLYAADPKKLTDDLIKLNKDGGGGLESLEKQARLATFGIGTAFKNMNNAVAKGIEGMVKAIGGGDLEAGQKKMSAAIGQVGKAFQLVLTNIGEFTAFLLDNQTAMAAFGGVVLGVLAAGFYILAGSIWAALAPALPIIAAFALIGVGVNLLVQQIGGWSVVWNTLKSAATQVWVVLQSVGSFLASVFKPAIDDMISSLKEAWAAFMPLWKQIDGFVIPALKALAIAFAVGIVFPAAIATASLIAITFAVIKVISWLSKVYTAIFNFANGAIKAFRSFASGVGSAISTAISWVASLPGRIKSTLGNLGSLLIGAGKDLINGLIAGIKASPGRVVDAIKSIAIGAKEAFKGFLGIKSPSKVFAGYGTNITEGLVGGISAGMSQVDSAVAGLSANVISPSIDANLSSDQGNQQQSSNPNINITINPEGIIARSRSDLRDIAKDLVRSINEELQAKQQPVIGGGNI